jgi:hypothetical protein
MNEKWILTIEFETDDQQAFTVLKNVNSGLFAGTQHVISGPVSLRRKEDGSSIAKPKMVWYK